MEISVIVPVYNAEKFLGRCIESLLVQDFADYEIILVDDGSADSSWEICRNFAEKDGRIVAIHQENSGVSSARNKGMDASRGKYLAFVDSDDYVEKNFLRVLHETISKDGVQMGMCGFKTIRGKKETIHGFDGIFQNQHELYKILIRNGFPWNKILLSSVVKENNLRYNEKLSVMEDLEFHFRYFYYVKKMCAVSVPVYNYVKRKGSAINPLKSESTEENLAFCRKILDSREAMLKFDGEKKIGVQKMLNTNFVVHLSSYILIKAMKGEFDEKCRGYQKVVRKYLAGFLRLKNPPGIKILAVSVAVDYRLAIFLRRIKKSAKKILHKK
jgi:glycosyltransferase involved in cell wall biosynthesis